MSDLWTGTLIIAAGIIAAFILYLVYRKLVVRADLTESQFDDIIVMAIGKPLIIGVIALSVYFALNITTLPAGYEWIRDSRYLVVIYIALAAWMVSIFVQNFIMLYGRWLASKTESDLDDKIISFLEVAARYIIWFISFLIILAYLNIDITPLIAGAGIFGIAVALAAQDLISNFFGGAIILIDKPFIVGERIKIDGNLGDVVAIGPRSTRIKTLDYQLITIPNSKIANSIVTNYNMPDIKLKIKIPVSVAYGSDVKKVKQLLLDIANKAAADTEYILTDPAPSVYFLEYGPSSLDYMMVVWAKVFNMAWDVKDYINTIIDERFREEGIEIPFPQMDVHLKER
jgi:MscS family membrane protein